MIRNERHRGTQAGRRPAYSLIEMLVVISVTVALLAMMYQMLVSVMRRASDPDIALSRFEAVSNATAELRNDLRRCDSFEIDKDASKIRAVRAGAGPIEWRIADRPFRLERREPGSATPWIFGLNGFRAGRFEAFRVSEASGPMVRLVLEPLKASTRRPAPAAGERPFEVEFAVNTFETAKQVTGPERDAAAKKEGAKP